MDRQFAIKDLLTKNQEISDHEMLLSHLADKYQIRVSQAAISRDLRILGVVKVFHEKKKKSFYKLPKYTPQEEILKLGVESISCNEMLIVIKTMPGMADFVGDYLDARSEELKILGTIAGENTIFVTPFSVKNIQKISRKISEELFI